MVKTYHVKQYLTDGIENNINNCEDTITSEYSNEAPNSFEVEFTDWSMGGDKSKYRIMVESIDEQMYKKKRQKLYREHICDFHKMIEETILQYPLRICVTDYQKLRDAINTIKEMDKALDSLRENESKSNG